MVHTKFIELLRQKYPLCVVASVHGGYSNARTKTAVTITFTPGGKCYDYSGSYADVLSKLGIVGKWVVRYSTSDGEEIVARYYLEDEAIARANKDNEDHARIVAQGWTAITREYTAECRG